jgi:transketolase
MTKIDMRDAFFEKLVEAARLDERIIVLSADHGAFALKKFEEEMPDRYINIGIAEQNMVGVAAGLAASGKIVFIYGISPFVSLRVLEQLTIDVAAMQLPVNVISVGAGFTYSTDGPTHQGLQDISAVATIPGMTILNSSDPVNTRAFVEMAISSEKPHYIRIEKEKLPTFERYDENSAESKSGFSQLKKGSSGITLLSTGRISHDVLGAAELLEVRHNLEVTVIDVYQLKQFPADDLLPLLRKSKWCISISEIYESYFQGLIGGLISKESINLTFRNFGVIDDFHFQGDERNNLLNSIDLDSNTICNRIEGILGL